MTCGSLVCGSQVDEEDLSSRPWNNIAQHTRIMISFLYKAVSSVLRHSARFRKSGKFACVEPSLGERGTAQT